MTRKSATTTTETSTERRTIEEKLIRRTRTPLKPAESQTSNGRKSREAAEKPQRVEKGRREETVSGQGT